MGPKFLENRVFIIIIAKCGKIGLSVIGRLEAIVDSYIVRHPHWNTCDIHSPHNSKRNCRSIL